MSRRRAAPAADTPPVVDLAFERAKAEARALLTKHPELRSERTAAFLAGEAEEVAPVPRTKQYAHLTLRLPADHLARLDALVARIGNAPELATVGEVSRSDALRLAVVRGIAQLEAEHPQATLPGMEAER